MDGAHLHLAINHIPVVGTGITLFLFLVGFIKKSDEVIKVSLQLFVLVAISAVPTFFSGEAAEEVVEHMPGMLEALIEQHEQAAKVSMILEIAAGILAVLGLILFRLKRSFPSWLKVLFLLILILAGGLMARTANLGGQIRHEEIRPSLR